MEDFRSYSPEDIILRNLGETALREEQIAEQETAHVGELANELLCGMEELSELLAVLPDRYPRLIPTEETGSDPLRTRIAQSRSTARRILLCRELSTRLRAERTLTNEDFFPEFRKEKSEEAQPTRVAYQKNGYTDRAYLQFAPLFHDSRASYTHSFTAACEEVYNGLCDCCILPLENAAEGRMTGFSRLIDRYGLKIAALCDVTAPDASRATRFAILRKELFPVPGNFQDAPLFEFSVRQKNSGTLLSELLFAAEAFGLSPCRIETIPDNAEEILRLAFFAKGADLSSYLFYLTMVVPHYEPIGFYTVIGENPDPRKD